MSNYDLTLFHFVIHLFDISIIYHNEIDKLNIHVYTRYIDIFSMLMQQGKL